MTDYVKSTNFASKDSLSVGNPLKIVKGTEIDAEFNNIATAVATKADLANPTFTGVPAAPTASLGTNTTQLATTAFVTAAVSTAVTAYDTALTVSTSQIENIAVTEAKIADNAVTQAKMADSSVGTAELINANVTPAKLSQPMTLGTAVASTSGTSIDFTSIPSWVKRITVMFNGVSNAGGNNFTVQLGDSGGIENTGYSGSAMSIASGGTAGTALSDGFTIRNAVGAGVALQGQMTICNISSNTWSCQGVFANDSVASITGGSKTLSATLDRVRITNASSDTFDAGSVNILYE